MKIFSVPLFLLYEYFYTQGTITPFNPLGLSVGKLDPNMKFGEETPYFVLCRPITCVLVFRVS